MSISHDAYDGGAVDGTHDDGSAAAGGDDRRSVDVQDAATRPDGTVGELSVLDELDSRPLHEHVAVYDELHARLQSALNRIDEA